jgi:hypothetical protein
MLVSDELLRRQDRLLERRNKLARFREPDRSLDTFDYVQCRVMCSCRPRRLSSC